MFYFTFDSKFIFLLKAITCVVLLLSPVLLPAQYGIVFSKLSKSEGLSSNSINCTFQDEKGFLWVGNENGLQRFDGRKFISFNYNDPSRMLPPMGVDELHDAGNNRVFVRQGNKIGLFDLVKHQYTRITTPVINPGTVRFQLYTDSKKNCYLLTGTSQLFIYHSAANEFRDARLTMELPPGWPISNMFADNANQAFWFYGDSGLAVFYQNQQKLDYPGKSGIPRSAINRIGKQKVLSFLKASDNSFWISYLNSVKRVSQMTIVHFDSTLQKVLYDTIINPPHSSALVEINRFMETDTGDIWATGIGSMMSYSKATGKFYQHLKTSPSGYGLECSIIYHLYQDLEKNVWLSTDNGLFMTAPAKTGVINFKLSHNSGEVDVQSIIQTSQKETWIGTGKKGIIFLDSLNRRIPVITPGNGNKQPDIQLKNILHLHQHRKDSRVWAAAGSGYLMVIDPHSKRIISRIQPEQIFGDVIVKMDEDSEGNLWFASGGGKILKWTAGSQLIASSFETVQKLSTNIQQFIIDKQDQKWIASTGEGLYLLDVSGTKIIKHFVHEESDPATILSDKINDIAIFNDSLMLAGTDGGLSLINIVSGSINNKTIYSGLPGTSIAQILPDNFGTAWMITNNGLCGYHVNKGFFSSYDQRDGIVNAQIATRAKMISDENILWFGGDNLMVNFIPDKINSSVSPPPVTITDFRILDNFRPVDSLLDLDYITLQNQEHSFSVYFSALNFAQQDKLSYYYKLEGVDQDWVYGDKTAMVTYSVLSPGYYTFKVRCENLKGESSPVTAVQIRIKPPFYKTWWFITVALLVLGAIIYWLYRQRIKRLIALEKLRTKVARDLHDDMGSTLSTINILSTMAKSRMTVHPENASEYLSQISENSQQMMEVMDDIVWSIKPDNDSMQKITGRMRELATSLMEAKDIELDFIADDNIRSIKLNMEARRDFFLIYKEAVNNIVKYSGATQVNISIHVHQNILHLIVEDNGRGFNIQQADSGNGLGNMQKRAEAVNGKLKIDSYIGKGTRIELNMPVQ